MVVTSKKLWESLPDDIRMELEIILAEVTPEVNRRAMEQAKEARKILVKNTNGQFFVPNEEEAKA